jgi:hypothetical protein
VLLCYGVIDLVSEAIELLRHPTVFAAGVGAPPDKIDEGAIH